MNYTRKYGTEFRDSTGNARTSSLWEAGQMFGFEIVDYSRFRLISGVIHEVNNSTQHASFVTEKIKRSDE
jgi:hypothetical protein